MDGLPKGGRLTRPDAGLLAEQTRITILESILDGRFTNRLPNEDALGEMLNVSRATVRAALQILEHEGIVTRRRALGTTINRHVSPSTLALQRLINSDLFLLLEKRGHDIGHDVKWTRGAPPEAFVDYFEMDATTECIVMEKTHRVDGLIVMHARSVVPVDQLREVEIEEPLPMLLPEFSDRYCRQSIAHSVARITAVAASTTTTRLDELNSGAFSRLLEILYSADADVVGRSILDTNDDFLRLEIFRRR